jgi:uncharacterized protein YjbJ (UPF0337 family)
VHVQVSNFDQHSEPHHSILTDTRLYIRQGNFPKRATWSQTVKAEEPFTNLNEPKATTQQRREMKPSTDDKTTGKLHEVKGAIKQKAGELTSSPNLQADGRAEKNAGKVQSFVGKVEKAVGE